MYNRKVIAKKPRAKRSRISQLSMSVLASAEENSQGVEQKREFQATRNGHYSNHSLHLLEGIAARHIG
jgi:hypothetical protein